MIDWRRTFRSLGVALNLREPPNLPPYGWSYFDHLVAVYVTLNKGDARADAVLKKSRERPDDLKWGDIYLLEDVIFSLQPAEVLERNAWIIRERFREIACSSMYGRYAQSNPPIETKTPSQIALLRADLCRVLDVLHWHYALIPIRERIRKTLTVECLFMVLFYTIALGVLLFWCHKDDASRSFLAMAASVLYCGTIGGFVSSQRRMQNIPTDTDPLISVFGLDNAGYYLWLSPLLGAIFAAVLTMLFIGGILKGTVFPGFFIPKLDSGLSFMGFEQHTLPLDGGDYAKLFIWCFLAGFAERLVPDSLDRLTSKLASDKADATPPSPPTGGVPTGPAPPPPRTNPLEGVSLESVDNALRSGEEPPFRSEDSGKARSTLAARRAA
jgi:hypothetical protein